MKAPTVGRLLARGPATLPSSRCFSSGVSGSDEYADNKLFVWGTARNGSLGFEDCKNVNRPRELKCPDGSGFRQATFGNQSHGAFITGKGDLYTFGGSYFGELGLGEEGEDGITSLRSRSEKTAAQLHLQKTPKHVSGLSDVVKVACGEYSTAAVTADGSLYTWGMGQPENPGMFGFSIGSGGLGHGDKENVNKPKLVEAMRGIKVKDVSCGKRHTLVLSEDGEVYAMGEGQKGRLGTGDSSSRTTPEKLDFFDGIPVRRVFAEQSYSFVIAEDARIFSWGANDRQQLGLGGGLTLDMYSCEVMPVDVELDGVLDIALSAGDVLAITDDDDLYQWGDRIFIEPTSVLQKLFDTEGVDVDALPKFTTVGAGTNYIALVMDDGSIWTCNKKDNANAADVADALGQGNINPYFTLRKVDALDGYMVRSICAADHSIAALVTQK